jgi:hypothetical protein
MDFIGNSRKRELCTPNTRHFDRFPTSEKASKKNYKTTSFLLAPGMLVVIVIVISATGRILVAGRRDFVSRLASC